MASPSATVLVVDDESALLDLATRVLRRHGHHIIPARSGEEAVRVFSSSLVPIHVVILDRGLPDGDGVEFFRRLRAIRPDLAVVFASGSEEDELPHNLRNDERVSFLQKPFRSQQLVAVLDRLLESVRIDATSLSSPKERRTAPVASSGGCP